MQRELIHRFKQDLLVKIKNSEKSYPRLTSSVLDTLSNKKHWSDLSIVELTNIMALTGHSVRMLSTLDLMFGESFLNRE